MNGTTLKELKVVVERAVRPVGATTPRKRKMREELLAHLVSIFEEETRHGDERTALEQAKERFGDPKELSRQLRDTVPWWDGVCSVIEKGNLQPGESLLHLAIKQLVAVLLTFGVILPVLLPLMIAGRLNEVGLMLRVLVVSGLIGYGLGFLASFMPLRMGRALYGAASERSLRVVVLSALLSLLIFPMVAFATYWMLTWDLASSLANLHLAWYSAPAAPIVLLMTARKMTEEMRYQEEWARLEIGE